MRLFTLYCSLTPNFSLMKYLIVGLGNIGDEYKNTRHNMGFRVVDRYAEEHNVQFTDGRYGFTAKLRVKNAEIVLLKPSTYMNLSGMAVRYWLQKENIQIENLLVVVDDLNLPFGALRLRMQGSNGGHNGLRNIESCLLTENYSRLRFGIGSDFQKGGQTGFVLGELDEEENKLIDERLKTTSEIITSFCLQGIERTMNLYNKRS